MRVLPFPVRQLRRVADQVCVVTGRFEWKAIQGSQLDGKIVKKKAGVLTRLENPALVLVRPVDPKNL